MSRRKMKKRIWPTNFRYTPTAKKRILEKLKVLPPSERVAFMVKHALSDDELEEWMLKDALLGVIGLCETSFRGRGNKNVKKQPVRNKRKNNKLFLRS